ncbi:hypothetical protein L1987_65216 [Smallanthus sonchifolius]|uniref:Uncharacterized protein n=1 Tax=Smallanthus sonchifolius TaxID=185202 RepID=A0ACB9BTS0_9ASTR|nr:hypothetical protein L1987_65216 [Smallanthus sonchifolius]
MPPHHRHQLRQQGCSPSRGSTGTFVNPGETSKSAGRYGERGVNAPGEDTMTAGEGPHPDLNKDNSRLFLDNLASDPFGLNELIFKLGAHSKKKRKSQSRSPKTKYNQGSSSNTWRKRIRVRKLHSVKKGGHLKERNRSTNLFSGGEELDSGEGWESEMGEGEIGGAQPAAPAGELVEDRRETEIGAHVGGGGGRPFLPSVDLNASISSSE